MKRDASRLDHKGEYATLKNALGSWFHQDALLDFETDEDIWADIIRAHDAGEQELLVEQLTALLERDDATIREVWEREAHSHSFETAQELREYLQAMLSVFRQGAAQQPPPADRA